MNLDRTKFLALATAVAAATGFAVASQGCTTDSPAAADGGLGDSGGGAGTGGTGGTAGTGGTGGSGGSTSDGGGGSGGSGGSTGDGGTCDDTVVPTSDGGDAAVLCPVAEGSTSCLTSAECTAIANGFKPAVAYNIESCLDKLSSTNNQCTPANEQKCVQDALAHACPDTTGATSCATLQQKCALDGGPTDAGFSLPVDCSQYVSGLTSSARDNFVNCLTASGDCTNKYGSCVASGLLGL